MFAGCETAGDYRIPQMPVRINLTDPGVWNTFGVSGYGMTQRFILYKTNDQYLHLPEGFPYTGDAATGYGGVLLISGIDPYTADADIPLAYDLSCPVECLPTVRVEVSNQPPYNAVCPKCHSVYNVTDAAGAPVSGEAVAEKLSLRRYACMPALGGGYMIVNR